MHALAALALVFAPLHGWHTGASGTTRSLYGPGTHQESAAWIANVRYRDRATSDPPNETLAHLPPKGIVVWAVIYDSAGPPRKQIRLDLGGAKRFDCCEGEPVAGGVYELTGDGPAHAYAAIVRIYFGSTPTSSLRAKAQRALERLRLPR